MGVQAGAVEAIFTAMAVRDGVAPPTLNLDHPQHTPAEGLYDHEALRLVGQEAEPVEIRAALTNSFGFGGTNASVVCALRCGLCGATKPPRRSIAAK